MNSRYQLALSVGIVAGLGLIGYNLAPLLLHFNPLDQATAPQPWFGYLEWVIMLSAGVVAVIPAIRSKTGPADALKLAAVAGLFTGIIPAAFSLIYVPLWLDMYYPGWNSSLSGYTLVALGTIFVEKAFAVARVTVVATIAGLAPGMVIGKKSRSEVPER